MLLAKEYQYKERNKISSPELFILKWNFLLNRSKNIFIIVPGHKTEKNEEVSE